MDWLGDNLWAGWLAFALILGIIETVTLDLIFLMLAGGAVAGAAAAALGASLPIQVIIAALTSAALLGVVRPQAKRRMIGGPSHRMGIEALVGNRAIVIDTVDEHNGTIKLAGEVWSARTFEAAEALPPGTAVSVISIRGATAFVHPLDEI